MVSVLVAGAACGHQSPLAIAEAAAGWDQELLAAHGCRVSPATGLRVAPSARTLYRVPAGLDADEFEAALTGRWRTRRWTRVPAAAAAKRQNELAKKAEKKRKPSRRPRKASARSGRTAGSGRTRCTRGWTPP